MVKKVFFTLFLILLNSLLYAEAIFLKNGEILEATVQKEDDYFVEIKMKDGEIRRIPRENIIRILFKETYKDKKYIYLTTGEEIECYIVAEDASSYTIREELFRPIERKILKKEIKIVTQEKIIESYLGLRLGVGTGSLFSTALFYCIGNFDFSLGPGFIYFKENEKKKIAIPIKLQVDFKFFTLYGISTYLFGDAVYSFGVKNYKSQIGVGGGIGLRFFKLFFGEISYQTVFKDSGFVIGFGIRFKF